MNKAVRISCGARSRWLRAVLMLVVFVGCAAGCSKKSGDESGADAGGDRQAVSDKEEGTGEDAGRDDDSPELVLGLPAPPGAQIVVQSPARVRLSVPMNMSELSKYYERALVDYEVIYTPQMLRVVGLRSYMPEIRGYPNGPLSVAEYIPAEQPKDVRQAAEDADAGEVKREVIISGRDVPGEAASKSVARYKVGDPILERTADGEFLAPGARWGEPYTPPPGSPLDLKRNRPNFGRPYGQWMAR